MNTKDKRIGAESTLLDCDASKCMEFKNGNWEERLEDLIFGVGP